jgi:hypothetical protein
MRWYSFILVAPLVFASTAVESTIDPPSHDLLFVQVPASTVPTLDQDMSLGPPLGRYVDGARIVLLPASDADPVVLTPEFTAACDPDVSFDGSVVVFAGKLDPADTWQIWRMNIDGSNKSQITRSEGDNITPVFAGNRFYLDDPQPTPQIIYASTAHGWISEHDNGPVFSLYGTDANGEAIHRLTFNLHSDLSPAVLPTGRIVYTSWQRYGDRYEPDGILTLMGVNIDGTDLMPFYGNHERPLYKDMASVSSFDDRVYFVESDRASWLGGGNISYVSRRRPLNSYQQLTAESRGRYHSPVSLPDGGLVASYRADDPADVFGLYRIDSESGERLEEILRHPNWHSLDAHGVAPRPPAKGRSNWLIPGTTTGVFYSLNAYRTNLAEPGEIPVGTVKHVRVIEGLPLRARMTLGDYLDGSVAGAGGRTRSIVTFDATRLLGVAPVAEDGSFHIRVPAETPVTFQLLDEDYLALRTQRAWTWVIGNESRGCIGCHEDRELSPPNQMTQAVIKPAVELTLPPGRRRTVDFRHQIAPIIESRCANGGCHVTDQPGPRLTGVGDGPESAGLVYQTLLGVIEGRSDERYVIPGKARESPLVWLLFGENKGSGQTRYTREITQMPPHDVLRPRQRILFTEWIDLGARWDVRGAVAVENERN